MGDELLNPGVRAEVPTTRVKDLGVERHLSTSGAEQASHVADRDPGPTLLFELARIIGPSHQREEATRGTQQSANASENVRDASPERRRMFDELHRRIGHTLPII